MKVLRLLATVAAATAAMAASPAHAALTSFASFVGNYGVSSDGFASSTSNPGTLTANIPAGATVTAAYLYTSTSGIGVNGVNALTGTFGGQAADYNAIGQNSTACCSLTAGRMDVTSIVNAAYSANSALGTYNFNVTESNTGAQDGEALVVVYQLASLGISTVAILDGFASAAGDLTSLNFTTPIDKTVPGFSAEMRLGIGFSFNGQNCSGSGQTSTVSVNTTTITQNAGCNDDSVDATAGNGNLFTMGGDNDAFSPLMPSVAADHERYNLVDRITQGDTSIQIRTSNSSLDDNVFLAVFKVSGAAGVNEPPPGGVPEPMSLALVGLALAGLGAQRKFAHRA